MGAIGSVGVMFKKLRSLVIGEIGWPSGMPDIRINGLDIRGCAGDCGAGIGTDGA